MKNLGLPSKRDSQQKICLNSDGDISFDPKTNAETFKVFFENLASDLVKKLPFPTNKFGMDNVKKYYSNLNLEDNNFSFKPITQETIFKLLEKTNPNKAVGIDNLAGRFLKDGASVISKPISELCNLSINLSHFPTDCKIAKLKPLYKKGSSLEPQNYRPISLFPQISKIFEKVIHEQTKEYIDRNKSEEYLASNLFFSKHLIKLEDPIL